MQPALFLAAHTNERMYSAALTGSQCSSTFAKASGLSASLVGDKLMRAAFDPEKGPLTDFSAAEGERRCAAHLLAGGDGVPAQSHGHRDVPLDSPAEAMEVSCSQVTCSGSSMPRRRVMRPRETRKRSSLLMRLIQHLAPCRRPRPGARWVAAHRTSACQTCDARSLPPNPGFGELSPSPRSVRGFRFLSFLGP